MQFEHRPRPTELKEGPQPGTLYGSHASHAGTRAREQAAWLMICPERLCWLAHGRCHGTTQWYGTQGAARRCRLCAQMYGVSRSGLHLMVVTMRRLGLCVVSDGVVVPGGAARPICMSITLHGATAGSPAQL